MTFLFSLSISTAPYIHTGIFLLGGSVGVDIMVCVYVRLVVLHLHQSVCSLASDMDRNVCVQVEPIATLLGLIYTSI